MRRWLALSVSAAVLLAPRAFAEEKTYTIPGVETWKVGDVVTKTERETKTQKQVVKDPEGNPLPGQTNEVSEKTSYEVVMKVLEVDAKGAFTKAVLHVKDWKRELNGTADTSLAGKTVELTGAGASRKATVKGEGVSAQAEEWLRNQFEKSAAQEDAVHALFTPTAPVAIGGSWDVDPAKLVAALGQEEMPFVADKSSGKLTLTGVEGTTASIDIQLRLQAGPATTPMGPMEWADGGVLAIDAKGVKSTDPAVHDGKQTGTSVFKGAGKMSGLTIEIDVKAESESATKTGGEIPAGK